MEMMLALWKHNISIHLFHFHRTIEEETFHFHAECAVYTMSFIH